MEKKKKKNKQQWEYLYHMIRKSIIHIVKINFYYMVYIFIYPVQIYKMYIFFWLDCGKFPARTTINAI